MNKPEKDAAVTRALELQAAFFSQPNLFRLLPQDCPMELAETMKELQAGLRRHAMGHLDRPLLLPVRFENHAFTVWYACAATENQLRSLEAELRAFIGTTYAWFRLPEDGIFVTDEHAQPLLRRSGMRNFVMWTQGSERDNLLLRKWRIYCDLLDRRPPLVAHMAKSFDALRADFDRALLVRDEGAANLALAAMRDRFGVSAENRLYLQIRLYAGLEQWDRIASHPLLSTLVKLRLPQETYADIVEALYVTRVSPFEQRASLDEVLTEFRTGLVDVAQFLFRTRRQSERIAVVKSFVLFELLQPSPQADVIHNLLELLPLGTWGPLESQIGLAIARLRPPEDPAELAWMAYEHEQFDRAGDLLWQLPDSVNVLRALIRCVDECRDPRRADALLDRMEAANPAVRREVEARNQKTWPRVKELARLAETDQMSWAQRMAWRPERGENLDAYVERWREWGRAVASAGLPDEPDFAGQAASLLEHLGIEHPEILERISPVWHEVFVCNAAPDSRFKPVYAALLETLRLPGSFGDVELTLVRDVLRHLLQAGMTASEYARTIQEISLVFEQVRSPHHMKWALDVCDVLAMTPCRDMAARVRLLAAVAQAGQEFAIRLGSTEISMLRMLTNEAGIEVKLPKSESGLEIAAIHDVANLGIIGIYSLDESAARRAVQVLTSVYGTIDVRVNSDTMCTPQLKALAHRATLFVFAWRSSKHAAFFCIKAERRPNQPIAMARGAGTTSIVDAVFEFIESRDLRVA